MSQEQRIAFEAFDKECKELREYADTLREMIRTSVNIERGENLSECLEYAEFGA